MEAAIFLNVPVWELERQPTHWRDRALLLKGVKAWAEVERRERGKYHW